MKESFPQSNKAYVQNNRTNVFPLGNIWSSLNTDFQTNLGVLRISPRFISNTTTQGCPVAFARFGQRIYALAGTTIYRNTNNSGLPSDAFVADTSTSASTDYSSDLSDMTGAWNALYATSPTRLRSLNAADGGTWSDRATISTGINHKLVYFKRFNRLYFSDQTIKSIQEDNSVSSSGDYTLPGANTVGIVDMKATNQFIWIAVKTEAILDGMGEVWQWDGISAQVTAIYKIPGARAVVALVIDKTRDVPMAISDKGILYDFNGSGFNEISRLPFGTNLPYMGAAPFTSQANDRFIHPNGVIYTKNETVQMLINGVNMDNTGTQNENLASGIWEWSPANGMVHIGTPSYLAIGQGFAARRDWGQEQVSRVGALTDMNIPSTASGRDGTFLAGVSIFTDATTVSPRIFFDNSINTQQKKGYLVTNWLESSEIASAWDVWWMSYRKFLESTDSITVKYRSIEEAPTQGTITWTANNTFTVLNSAVDVSEYWTSGTGGEVEIVRGDGSSACAHITNAVNNAGTWTVTLDEAINPAGPTSATAVARFQKWIKLFTADTNPFNSPTPWTQLAINTNSTPRIQIKMCFTYTGNGEFYKAFLTGNEDIIATK